MEQYPPNQQQPAPPPYHQGQQQGSPGQYYNPGQYPNPGQNYPPPTGGYPPPYPQPYQQQPYGYPGPQAVGPKIAWMNAFQVICLIYAILLGMSFLTYLGFLVIGVIFSDLRVVAPGFGSLQMLFQSLVPASIYILLVAAVYIVIYILLYRAIKARRRSALTLVLVLNILMPATNLLSIPFSRSMMSRLTMALYMMMTELDIPMDSMFMTMMDRAGTFSVVYSVIWAAVIGGLLTLNTIYFRKRRELFH